MQAVLQMSAAVPYSAPIRTSRARYCLVCMSSVKCLCCRGRRHRGSNVIGWTIPSLQDECTVTTTGGGAKGVTHHPAGVPQVGDLHPQLVGVLGVKRAEDEVRGAEP